jgi:hypothetical protein
VTPDEAEARRLRREQVISLTSRLRGNRRQRRLAARRILNARNRRDQELS